MSRGRRARTFRSSSSRRLHELCSAKRERAEPNACAALGSQGRWAQVVLRCRQFDHDDRTPHVTDRCMCTPTSPLDHSHIDRYAP